MGLDECKETCTSNVYARSTDEIDRCRWKIAIEESRDKLVGGDRQVQEEKVDRYNKLGVQRQQQQMKNK